MKKITSIVLLTAGILLSLTGCQKGTEVDNSGKLVRFSASTGVNTRTAYSGVLDTEKKIERIDWTAGDEIIIWSDYATVRNGGSLYGNDKLAVYKIGSITASGEKSVATIEDNTGGGLQYPDNEQACTFWGVYPASAVTASPEGNSVPFVIEAEQALAANDNTDAAYDYAPDMKQAVMLAYVSGAKGGDKSVEIPFKPAFTDFEFNLEIPADATAAENYSVTISEIEFNSESSALSGGFAATCTNGTWGYTIATDAAKTIKATLPGSGLTLDKDNPKLTLNVFALPQDITNLKVTFYTNEGPKTLKLLAEDKTTWLTFTGAKKHRLNGVILPTGWYFKYITLDLKVVDWQAVDVTGGSEEFPQATQFAVSGEGVKNGYKDINHSIGDKDPYRQQWYFQKGQTVTVFFKIMLPVNATWLLEPVGGVEGAEVDLSPNFVFTNAYTGATGDAALTGTIDDSGNTAVKVEITYTGDDAASFFFHSYAIKGGIKYNIDSETQIYDRGRGYHTFFVNNPAYNN